MLLDLVRTTAPATTPVDLEEVKGHLGVESVDWDSLIEAYVEAAVGALDGYAGRLGRCLVEQTWTLYLEGFPNCAGRARAWGSVESASAIRLPLPPLRSVTSISYVDPNGAPQTLTAGDYTVIDGPQARILPAYGLSWPSTRRQARAVTVVFKAGWLTADLPPPLRVAILLMVGDLFANRETVALGAMSKIPMSTTVEALIGPYKLPRM